MVIGRQSIDQTLAKYGIFETAIVEDNIAGRSSHCVWIITDGVQVKVVMDQKC